MKTITVSDAARGFMAILKAAESGEEVVITRAGKPVAKLVGTPLEKSSHAVEPVTARLRSAGWRNHS